MYIIFKFQHKYNIQIKVIENNTMKNNIAQNMIIIMEKHNRKNIWYGDIELIEECARLSGVMKIHPQNTIQCILNALEKSNLFKKGYIKSDINGSNRKYRCFIIKTIH